MAVGYGVAVPKGKTRRQLKARKDREDAKQLKAWASAAWAREPGHLDPYQWGFCFDCRCMVFRCGYQPKGDVHHIVSRRHKESRYDVANAVLLCRLCHNKRHGREF